MTNLHRRPDKGFTLIELMIVVAIIGILAALAVPAYLDFMVREKSAEIIAFAASHKTAIVEHYMSEGTMPIWPQIQNPSRYIRRIEFWRARDDRLVIHVYPSAAYSNEIDVDEDAILLEAADDGAGNIKWTCGPHSGFRAVPKQFLPSTCRDWIDDAR